MSTILRKAYTVEAGAVTRIDADVPASTPADAEVFAWIQHEGAGSVITPDEAGWTEVYQVGFGARFVLYHRTLTASPPATYGFANAGLSNTMSAILVSIDPNGGTIEGVTFSTGTTGSLATATTLGVAGVNSPSTLLAFFGNDTNYTVTTPPVGMTEVFEETPRNTMATSAYSELDAGTGTLTRSLLYSGADQWGCILALVEESFGSNEITRDYELRIYNAAGDAVETTFDESDIVGLPSFGWTTPVPLEGRVENIPSVIVVADEAEQVTSILSGADGRADLIGRIADIRIDEDGAGMAVVHRGRITEIRMTDGVASYGFHVADERWAEDADVLTSGSTTQILPSGTRTAFKTFDAAPTMQMQVVNVIDANTLTFTPVDPVLVTKEVLEWLENDQGFLLPFLHGETPFQYTKLNIGGADRDIVSFARDIIHGFFGGLNEPAEDGEPKELQYVAVEWTGHGKSLGDKVSGAYIHAPDAPPTEWTPIHVGGIIGQEPFDWIKDQYDTLGIGYESDAFSTYNVTTNPNGLITNPKVPLIHIRATKPVRLRDMVEKICKMCGVIPFINSAGEVAPRFVTMPQDVDPSTLTNITGTVATPPHPTWSQTSGDIVTVIQPRFTYMTPVRDAEGRTGADAPVDRIMTKVMPLIEVEHDRVDELGRHVLELDLELMADPFKALYMIAQQTREIFDRYGDGPISGSIRALSGGKGVQPGDYVTITITSYPNMAIQARGGTRVVQIMSREVESGYTFTYLDAGPNEQPLIAPVVAIIKNATDGVHAVDVTISSLTANSTYELQLKIGSEDWVTVQQGDANETVTLGSLPSGTNIQARALEAAPARIRSAYSSPVNVTLDSLTAPSSLTVASIAGDRAIGTWTNGESTYDIEVLLEGIRQGIVEAGSTKFQLTGLTISTAYNTPGMQVRHIDRFGGASALDTDTFNTTGGATGLTQPYATRILVGGDVV